MRSQRKILPLAAGLFAVMSLQAEPTFARYCFWDGSSPFCRGKCPRGYVTTKIKACFNGYKVQCCEPMRHIKQGQKRR